MKKNIFITLVLAFIISLIIHFIAFDLINKKIANAKLSYPTTNIKKKPSPKKGFSNVKFVKLKKEVPKEKPIEQKKPTINQEVKKILEPIKKPIAKKSSKPKAIELPKVQKPDLKSFFTVSKEDLKRIQEEKEARTKQITEFQKEIQKIKQLDQITQEYIRLYGDTYFTFSKEQKTYLKNNLSRIGMITQRYLVYPGLSIKTRQSGINVIEFVLHPNGDISDVRITDSSNYTALDKNTVETIQLAYKDYPKPSEPTQIKIYVRYILY
ncbi:MAG: TonB family protein [Arcobacteraceae bacterium]|nr:TonB family protein [Arcobacteraceae bacterium]